MHIARVGERLPRLQIQFRISRSFRLRNLANLGSKIRFGIRRKEHTHRVSAMQTILSRSFFRNIRAPNENIVQNHLNIALLHVF